MRKCILLLMLAGIAATSYSQKTLAAAEQHDYDYYMKKSKRQNTLSGILGVAGSAAFGIILLKDVSQMDFSLYDSGISGDASASEYKSYTKYYVASGAVMAASTFLYYTARKNKRIAAALQTSVKMEQAPVLYSNGFGSKSYPSVSLKVGL